MTKAVEPITGGISTAPVDAKVLAAHVSRALPEVVRDINKPSDNALARTVFLSTDAAKRMRDMGLVPPE